MIVLVVVLDRSSVRGMAMVCSNCHLHTTCRLDDDVVGDDRQFDEQMDDMAVVGYMKWRNY